MLYLTEYFFNSSRKLTALVLGLYLLLFYRILKDIQKREAGSDVMTDDASYDIQLVHDRLCGDSLIIGYSWGFIGDRGKEHFDYYFEKMGSGRRVDLMAGREKDIQYVQEALRRENPRYVWYIRAHDSGTGIHRIP